MHTPSVQVTSTWRELKNRHQKSKKRTTTKAHPHPHHHPPKKKKKATFPKTRCHPLKGFWKPGAPTETSRTLPGRVPARPGVTARSCRRPSGEPRPCGGATDRPTRHSPHRDAALHLSTARHSRSPEGPAVPPPRPFPPHHHPLKHPDEPLSSFSLGCVESGVPLSPIVLRPPPPSPLPPRAAAGDTPVPRPAPLLSAAPGAGGGSSARAAAAPRTTKGRSLLPAG